MLTWACTDNRLAAIAPFYGAAPKPRKAIRRATGPAPACERGGQGWSERDLMQLNGWTSPQMLRRYDASARDRRTYGCIMGDSP